MNCPRCGAPATHVAQYQAWYCEACQAYATPPAATKSGVNLWLVIGLPVALVAIAIVAIVYVTTSSFKRYVDRSKTSETYEHLHALQQGARIYYETGHSPPGSMQLLTGMMPDQNVGPTPSTPCCDQGGQCAPNASDWDHETWRALDFEINRPHYYQYEYQVDADGFTVRALGDLDCDGELSTFEMYGRIESGELILTDAIYKENELE